MTYHTNPWYYVTFLGDPRVWLAVAIILFIGRLYFKNKQHHGFKWVGKFILFSGFGMGAAFGVSELLKIIFQIPRLCTPDANVYCNGIGTLSFPSSHATIAFAVFVGIFYVILHSHKNNKKKSNPLIWLWIFIIPVLVGVSRVLLGVHTYLDVVGGSITGILVTILFIEVISRISFFDRWNKSKAYKATHR